MNKPIPTFNELSVYYNNKIIIEKVVAQISKDFGWINLSISFSGDKETPYQELFFKILPIVDELLNDDYGKLQSLLYRIDIDSEFINRKLKENPQADTSEIITDCIIKRELQKVIIKELYKP
ncbi:MAG: hypothetical protein IT232_04010 [Flavobacteriales bacterium]|nr:hypothetical protein [Flavobacteriales bacterium]